MADVVTAGAGGPPPPPTDTSDEPSPAPSPPALAPAPTGDDSAADTPPPAVFERQDDDVELADLEAADSASDEEDEMDADLMKLRARQAAKEAKIREAKRNETLQLLLFKYGVEFNRPEYLAFIPSLLIQGLLTGFKYEMTSPQLQTFAAQYKAAKRLPLPESLTPQGLKVTPATFHKHVGKRRFYRDLVRTFRSEFKTLYEEGQQDLRAQCEGLSSGEANRLKRAAPPPYAWAVHKYLPLLMGGAAGGYFAGLIALGIGLDNAVNSYGNTDAMADALAYMAFTNAPMGKLRPPLPKQPDPVVEEPPLTPSSGRGSRGRAGSPAMGGRSMSPGPGATPRTGRGAVGGRSMSPAPGVTPRTGRGASPVRGASRLGVGMAALMSGPTPGQGRLSFLEMLAATRDDKRVRALLRRNSGAKSKYTKTRWGYPRSYHQRVRILSDKGQTLCHELFSKWVLYSVNFENVADPYFTGPPRASYGPQTPADAMQRAIWMLADDIIHLYLSTAHPVYGDYYLLNAVLAAWAMTRVIGMVGGLVQQHNLLLHFGKAVMVMFVARGRPKFHPKLSDKKKKKDDAAAAAGAGESKAGESKTNSKDPAAEMREKMEAQKKARLEAQAAKAGAEAELKARAALPPIPSWEGLLAEALEAITDGADPSVLMLYRAAEDLADFEDLQPAPWPPKDPGAAAAAAAAAAKKLELLKKLGLPAAGLPEPLTTDEILRKMIFLSYTRPATFHAPA